MSDEQWLSFKEAVKLIRSHLNASIGRAEALLRSAHQSGEVRSYQANVLLLTDDGLLSGFGGRSQSVLEEQRFSEHDLLDWLDRQDVEPAKATPKRQHSSPKQDRAKEAVEALWQNDVPNQSRLPKQSLCREVIDWLKSDCKKRNVEFFEISNDVILRAAGRK